MFEGLIILLVSPHFQSAYAAATVYSKVNIENMIKNNFLSCTFFSQETTK